MAQLILTVPDNKVAKVLATALMRFPNLVGTDAEIAQQYILLQLKEDVYRYEREVAIDSVEKDNLE